MHQDCTFAPRLDSESTVAQPLSLGIARQLRTDMNRIRARRLSTTPSAHRSGLRHPSTCGPRLGGLRPTPPYGPGVLGMCSGSERPGPAM